MYAYFFTSDGRRVRVWQESVRGMPLLRLEAPVKLNQRRCRRIRRWLKRCSVHRLLNRPAHWPESEPLPPLIGTRELWITKAPETALALLAQAGISPAQAQVEFCSDRFTPELADTAMALAPAVRALSFSCPVSEAFCWQLQRDHGLWITPDSLSLMVVVRLSLSRHPRQVVRSPCGSASTRSTFLPSRASPTPKLTVVVVLPVPPF